MLIKKGIMGSRKQYFFVKIFTYLLFFYGGIFTSAQDNSVDNMFLQARNIRHQNPDSSLVLLEKVHHEYLKIGDTINAVNALLEMPDILGQKGNYATCYEFLWQALFLSDGLNDDVLTASIYNRLGRLHSFFKRKEKAFYYLNKALEIKKGLVEKGELNEGDLVENYFFICSTYREIDDTVMGRKYLDSCFLLNKRFPDKVSLPYLNFEKAYVLFKENKHEEALVTYRETEPWFLRYAPAYLVLLYTYWGDLYIDLNDYAKGENMYEKALAISDKYNSHIDFTPLIYERLSNTHLQNGDYKKSFENLKKAKELDVIFFDSRSEKNKAFLEIKDEYRIEKERQEKVIQKQKVAQLIQEDKISLLQRIILLGSLVFLGIIGFIYVRQLRAKHEAEKQLIRKNKELEINKAKELLELKNKELAASALQLIEKDEFLRSLKNNLKEKSSPNDEEINRVIKSISLNNDQSWEEFKLRFTAVNKKFYKKLTKEFPNLSQGDQKICALIKLNFSSKDMSRLLGISVESVHTTRHRLRKKMNLPRSTNLENFIASL